MVRTSGVRNGRRFILLGLSRGNLDRLQEGQPILLDAAPLGFDGEIGIMFGETEEAIVEELQQSTNQPLGRQ